MKIMLTRTCIAALALGAGIGCAHTGAGPMGPGMMDGCGPGHGMMGGHGPGQGMGPGMMGGSGPGSGMGPGMMGGSGPGMGMGPGIMGGDVAGSGAGRGLGALDLNESQRTEIAKIQDENRRRHRELMGRMRDEMSRMRDAFSGGTRDRAAIAAALDRMHELRKQRVEQALDGAERIEKLLTPEQREQLHKRSPAWMMWE
ncbi:Spy/CpxP family protein refolding chaperone [Quisquiliibacterium transsilvanicum]|uniref:Spy/CpxP family protein refolding chaperone n=1 Tax=Quisquiliibacterium transsilvanicum TaxID=1549638 RepID=A0A7W8HH73_9BURK|nr:Spy/CpxP family protein refolding chaperone [Quisquiliibacterium transsilvanicum]MBB5271223.1 Spy/CpxP family protein refolding chaperone [Quisquiliibacterium transsilvanicum]